MAPTSFFVRSRIWVAIGKIKVLLNQFMNLRPLYLSLNNKVRRFTVIRGGFNGFTNSELIEFAIKSPFEADVLYRSRNVVWKTNRFGRVFVVKTFGGNIIKSLIYAFRKSKAKRSYEHALELRKRGIETPEPIGFVEIRGLFNILSHSCYASDYINDISLADAIVRYGKPCLAAFAGYVALLHKKGIRHDDLNNSNVRVSLEDNLNYRFSLIDLNRMKIMQSNKRVPINESISNTCRFWCTEEQYKYFSKKYLEASGLPQSLLPKMEQIKISFESNYIKRKRIIYKIKKILTIK